jgi:hypothetical protein
VVIAKPPFGAKCNGCGQCCEDTLCPLGAAVFDKDEGPCPALERRADDSSTCGLVTHPAAYAPVLTAISGAEAMSAGAAALIGAGHGCDGQVVGESVSQQTRRALYAKCDAVPRPVIARAMMAWRLRP